MYHMIAGQPARTLFFAAAALLAALWAGMAQASELVMFEQQGCGYCLRLRWYHGDRAIALLREKGIAYGKVYILEEDGIPREYLP